MAIAVHLRTHRQWEDWLGIGLGLLIALSPWAFRSLAISATAMPYIALNAVIVGLVIAGVSALEISLFAPWEEWLNMVLGLWVALSPWIFGYSALRNLMVAHVVLGLLVAGLAAIERWQDTRRPTTAD